MFVITRASARARDESSMDSISIGRQHICAYAISGRPVNHCAPRGGTGMAELLHTHTHAHLSYIFVQQLISEMITAVSRPLHCLHAPGGHRLFAMRPSGAFHSDAFITCGAPRVSGPATK